MTCRREDSIIDKIATYPYDRCVCWYDDASGPSYLVSSEFNQPKCPAGLPTRRSLGHVAVPQSLNRLRLTALVAKKTTVSAKRIFERSVATVAANGCSYCRSTSILRCRAKRAAPSNQVRSSRESALHKLRQSRLHLQFRTRRPRSSNRVLPRNCRSNGKNRD